LSPTVNPVTRFQNLVLISKDYNCLQHYFGLISKSVVRFASESLCDLFQKKRLSNAISEKTEYYPFIDENDIVETSYRIARIPGANTIVSFDALSQETITHLLKVAIPKATFIMINLSAGIKTATLDTEGVLSINILADPETLDSIFRP